MSAVDLPTAVRAMGQYWSFPELKVLLQGKHLRVFFTHTHTHSDSYTELLFFFRFDQNFRPVQNLIFVNF